MSWFSKAASWVGSKVKSIAPVLAPVLGVAGFAAGLVAPGVGAAIGKIADKIGNKVSDITGIGDGKPGIFGIGDGLPGVFGIGTGKGKEAIIQSAVDRIKALTSKVDAGQTLSEPEIKELEDAKKAAGDDMKKEGINPLYLIGGGLLALFALRK